MEQQGTWIVHQGSERAWRRAIVVLDENNTVVYSEQIEDITIEPDYEAAFRALGIDVPDE